MRKIILVLLSVLALVAVLVYLSVSETTDTFRTCEILEMGDVDRIDFSEYDSVTVAANTLYEASWLKEWMQGEQYRDAWAAPVTVPIAYLDTLRGGLEFVEEGGGKQTHSLEFEDSRGIRYTFRSLSKDPEKLVPDLARVLGIENIVIDGVSAQHPYAALVVSELADAARILHTHPKLVFLPAQERLDELNDKYGNRLYFFEYESEGEVDWTGLPGALEIVDTDDLQELKMKMGDSVKVDIPALVRARLFDLLIGDWDRHAKQWGWVMLDRDSLLLAVPLPADRDNAFFDQDGVLPTLISNNQFMPDIQSFNGEIAFLPGLVRDFDAYFLSGASAEQFRTEAERLQELLGDPAIERAFRAWPHRIDSLDGPQIRRRLEHRRDSLADYAVKFHRIIQEQPREAIVLSGSEDLELSGPLARCFECSEE